MSHYSNIRSQRYEYYDNYVANIDYTIDSIKIKNDNTYLYYTQCYPENTGNRVDLITKRTPIGENKNLPDIANLPINNTNPQTEVLYKINIGTTRIAEKVTDDPYGFSSYTDILIYLNVNKAFNGTGPFVMLI